MGSMFANVMLNRDTPLPAGVVGIALLVVLQVAVTRAITRWRRLGQTIQSEPRLLLLQATASSASSRSEHRRCRRSGPRVDNRPAARQCSLTVPGRPECAGGIDGDTQVAGQR